MLTMFKGAPALKMEHLHSIREIVEEHAGVFQEGEYLSLMNSLMDVSKQFSSDNQEEEFGVPSDLIDLYNIQDYSPRTSTLDDSIIGEKFSWMLRAVILSESTEAKLKLLFCVFAFAFQNYQYLRANEPFAITTLEKIGKVIDCCFFDERRTQILYFWRATIERDIAPMERDDPESHSG
jgi:hypothetical protein